MRQKTQIPSNAGVVTSVDLSRTEIGDKTAYHLLYGSQLYGVLFGVYGKFTATINEVRDEVSIEGIDFLLINYRGALNIGFVSAPEFIYKTTPDASHIIRIHVGVKQSDNHLTERLDFSPHLVLDRNSENLITIDRLLHPVPSGTSAIGAFDVFDHEFQYRDGDFSEPRDPMPGMIGYPSISIDLGSPRCHQSTLSIIF